MITRCFVSFLLLASFACNKDEGHKADQSSTEQQAGESGAAGSTGDTGASKRPEGPTGTITGKVTFSGDAPEMPKLQRGADPFCAKKEMHAETVVVNDGGTLRDVHVRIARGGAPSWVPPKPVVIDQKDCMYRPRVQGAVVGQKLVIKNDDGTTHNVHLRAMEFGHRQGRETIFNRAQPKGVPPIQSTVVDEPLIKVKCDQHAWMSAYLVVSDNPYFDTTGEDGTFTIEKVPVGTYKLEAWHSFYGKKTAEVTVKEGETAEVSFSYDAEKDKPAE